MFKNLKTRKKARGKFLSFNLVCEEVATLKLIKYCLLSILSLNTI